MKGVKTSHCLDIDNTTDLLQLHYDDLDFELGPAPYNYLKLKYPIRSVHLTQCLSVVPDRQITLLKNSIEAGILLGGNGILHAMVVARAGSRVSRCLPVTNHT
jgi:hypothetical protein